MNIDDPETLALDSYFARFPGALAGQCPILIFRAAPGAYLDRLEGRPIRCCQTYKPAADELARRGHEAVTEPEGPAALIIVLATKHKEEVLYHVARAASLLEEGGTLIVSAANDLGAASLEKRCAEAFGGVETYSKHKCRVFRARKDTARMNLARLRNWEQAGEWQAMADTGLWTRPGLFSWKSVDPGSRLLAEHLSAGISGRGADLGAGYGYLSRELLAHSQRITELHLVDAEWKALEAAQRNLSGRAGDTVPYFHWADATQGLPFGRLDFVVMNPPFHAGREAVSALGRAFVRAALKALKPGGRLFLVANRRLPYEGEIRAMGGQVESQAEGGGFKVIRALKA